MCLARLFKLLSLQAGNTSDTGGSSRHRTRPSQRRHFGDSDFLALKLWCIKELLSCLKEHTQVYGSLDYAFQRTHVFLLGMKKGVDFTFSFFLNLKRFFVMC